MRANILVYISGPMLYWALKREYYRWLWRRGRVTAGQFMDALENAPTPLRRDTTPFWKRGLL